MSTIRFNAYPGSISGYLTSLGGSGEVTNPYPLEEVFGYVHEVEVPEDIVGKWYLGVDSPSGDSAYEILNFQSVGENLDLTLPYTSDQDCEIVVNTGNAGPGAIEKSVTIYSGMTVLTGADVWISTDEAGSNVIAGTLVSDALGVVKFMLDIGVYYLWVQKAGHNFSNPTELEVTNDNN